MLKRDLRQLNFDFAKGKEVGLFVVYSQRQVDNINLIIEKCNKYELTAVQTAYVLATAYHEGYNPSVANSRITSIREFGGAKYLQSKKYYPYYGRGFVQLTWLENYRKESKRLGVDFVNNPDLVLNEEYASDILVHGMKNGSFTGKKLSDYINNATKDYDGARRIINGVDKKELIAGYAMKFEKCIDYEIKEVCN